MSTLSQFLATGLKSVQTGYVTLDQHGSGEDGRYKDVTINAVNTAKCMVDVFNRTADAPNCTVRLINSTTLRVSGRAGDGYRWYVYEFY